ncbi:SGNH hydrolase-type esterase domain-containing protein [Pseudoneurospora amorphoporcata]|uniref:SGNH hydrolase-type esterase domain-containing protein n=1 Tax=Pseudoneurospora amorphoporcata TaxID=241081 RepID=A0AAN6NVA2_9PEZI|nr:SGNH hydrolase-type esterase domain-containing protein [Pseudoneurospora amorphoporcata]
MAVSYPQIVLFGDSLFQGAANLEDGFCFQAAVQQQVLRRFDVVNRGLSGYNTSNALKLLPQIISPPGPGVPKLAYLFILLGANDAALPRPVNNQHVPLDKYKQNLVSIITHPNIAAHNPKIFLVTPPPLDELKTSEVDLGVRKHCVSASYSEAVRQVAAENSVGLIDLWKALMYLAISKTPGFDSSKGNLGDPETGERGHLESLLPDGLHLSAEAFRVFYDVVKPHLGQEWECTNDEERVGYVLPDWKVAPWLEEDVLKP